MDTQEEEGGLMLAEIREDNCIWIIAENKAEALALSYLTIDNKSKEQCGECGDIKGLFVFDGGSYQDAVKKRD
jgi:hypothetical protein